MSYQIPLTDFNDVTSIIEREEKEKKDIFFSMILIFGPPKIFIIIKISCTTILRT